MSAQRPASPNAAPNVTPPSSLSREVPVSRPVTASSFGGQTTGSTALLQVASPHVAEPSTSDASRLVIPEAGVASSSIHHHHHHHGELGRPPRTPPGPDNPFKSAEGSQVSHAGGPQVHLFDSQSRGSPNRGGHMSAIDHGNSHGAGSSLAQPGDSHLLPPPPQPVRVSDRDRPPIRPGTGGTRLSGRRSSALDWIVPVSEEDDLAEKTPFHHPHHAFSLTYKQRLEPTIEAAKTELVKYEEKAKRTGWSLNVAIGLQVLLGSLTTGLSAVATSGKSAAVSTTILGGMSTVVASYLARSRGSNEPELSITRSKDLQQFLRECSAFEMDYGYLTGKDHDKELIGFRERFEELLGNGDGQRKLSPPV